MDAMASLLSARALLDSCAWASARDEFASVATASDDPRAYEGLAQAGWWLDDADTCLGAREDAYRAFRRRGDDLGAARAATALAWDSVLFGRGEAVGLGWRSWAETLLQPLPEAAEHGWLAVRGAELALGPQHDPALALRHAQNASAVGHRLGVSDLAVVGTALEGLALTQSGDVSSGMPLLDAAVAAATSGDVTDVMWMGKVCCWLIAACDETRDVGRAAEWCTRVEAMCRERDLAPLFNVCRIKHASIQVALGTWVEAEQELTQSLDRLSLSQRSSRLEAVVQLGELRRRQGRLAEAVDLLSQAEFDPLAIVARARIKLARGDARGASSMLDGLLRSVPDSNVLARAGALLAAVQAAYAVGSVDEAASACTELRATAEAIGTDPMLGMASAAEAELASPTEAVSLWRQAVQRYHSAGLRFDEAEARLSLAEALRDSGDESGCREQLDIAMPVLVDLSAADCLARAHAIAASIERGAPGPLTPREVEVLRLVARGMSNQEIASTLVVSDHTVHRHVANILAKLDQPSRAGAVAVAMSQGLL